MKAADTERSERPARPVPPFEGGFALASWTPSGTGGFCMVLAVPTEAQAENLILGRCGPFRLFRLGADPRADR